MRFQIQVVIPPGDQKIHLDCEDPENKRISLGMKQLTADPWKDIESSYEVGKIIKAKKDNQYVCLFSTKGVSEIKKSVILALVLEYVVTTSD